MHYLYGLLYFKKKMLNINNKLEYKKYMKSLGQRHFHHMLTLSISTTIELVCVWPPIGINVINPFKLPLLNTFLLLQSGIYITLCHMYLCIGYANRVYETYIYTLICGFIFTLIQIYEYIYASF